MLDGTLTVGLGTVKHNCLPAVAEKVRYPAIKLMFQQVKSLWQNPVQSRALTLFIIADT